MPMCKVGGVMLPSGPYMIGAGVCKTSASTAKWLQVVPVVSGSYTKEQRDGNEGKVMCPDTLEEFLDESCGGNSYGMPNVGFQTATSELSQLESEEPVVVSVAGFSPGEYLSGVENFYGVKNVLAIELNFGCPNTQGSHPDIMSFNPEAVRNTLWLLVSEGLREKPIWLKFSPYSNPAELKRMAELVNNFIDDLSVAIVTCNTFPNAYFGEGKISPNNGLAGLSGKAMKPIALGQVRQFRQHLDSSIDVIGVGGITTGDDVMDFLEAGAKAVQITSLAHWSGNPNIFLEHLMNPKTSSRFIDYMTNES